jgi:site-specific recombinase XerD
VFELKTSSIQSLYRHIARELEIAKFHPHAMRHTAATMMLRGGMDIESLRRILGHTNITTTARYLSLQTEDLRDKLDAASPVASMTPSSPVQVRRRRLQRERTPLRLIKTG